MLRYCIILYGALISLPCASAYADIGTIGSPVVPSNVMPSNTPPDKSAALPGSRSEAGDPNKASPEKSKLLMVLRFDHRHHHMLRLLRESIDATEMAHPNALYQVVSYVPSGAGARVQTWGRLNEAALNLQWIVQNMQDEGIPTERIQFGTQYTGLDVVQEIDIWVRWPAPSPDAP